VKRRIAVAAALAATLIGAAACGSSSNKAGGTPTAAANPLDGKGKTLTVWLMVDAQSGWPQAVADANAKFTKDTGAQVNIQYQQWTNHLAKVDTTLAGSQVPDVMELGNTEEPKYVFGGAFADLSSQVSSFDNSSSWLSGLSGPCQTDGKTFCVPYYAGARVLIYRTDLFTAAGLKAPTTYDELISDATALQAKYGGSKDPKFSAFYLPSRYWYAAGAFIYGAGGKIADKGADGKWTGTLESQQSEAGLTQFATIAQKFSKGDPTKTEADQDAIFAQGHSAMLYGNGWELGAVQSQPKDPNDPTKGNVDTVVKGKVAAVPLPGASAGNPLPSFLGGSDLAVTAKSQNKALAAEWIKDFTSTNIQQELIAKGVLPNATALLPQAAAQPGNEATANAAKNSWFTPLAANWADVESANVLQLMLQNIVTKKQTVDAAAKAADAQITTILNKS
jgi:N,N'-diacetylchitobiose transport system substrate-binding protein